MLVLFTTEFHLEGYRCVFIQFLNLGDLNEKDSKSMLIK